MEPITFQNAHGVLVAELPEFRSALEEHLRAYGEVLQHVLFGDLTRFVLDAHERGDRDLVRGALEFLDRAMRTDDEQLHNLVAVSFVENVEPWNPGRASFIATWPDSLQSLAREQGWSPA